MRFGAKFAAWMLAALVFASAPVARAQQLNQPTDDPQDGSALLQRVAKSMSRYSRDISEIPIHVDVTVSRYNLKGELKDQHSSSHTMQFVKRYVTGDRVIRELTWKTSLWHRVSKDDANADSATSLMALLFDNGQLDSSHTYGLTLHKLSNKLELKIGHTETCEPFDPMNLKNRLWCGVADLWLDANTLMPLKATFDENGLPHDFGGTVYKSFHFEEEFREVPIEGSGTPLLLPSKMSVVYEDGKWRTEVHSRYSVPPK